MLHNNPNKYAMLFSYLQNQEVESKCTQVAAATATLLSKVSNPYGSCIVFTLPYDEPILNSESTDAARVGHPRCAAVRI